VPGDDVRAVELGEEGRADLAGERALLLVVGVLGAELDVTALLVAERRSVKGGCTLTSTAS
jgi:hypothetical protein